MIWPPWARATFAIAGSIVILLFFLGLSIAMENWRFFLWNIPPVAVSLSVALSFLTPHRPTPHHGSTWGQRCDAAPRWSPK